MWTKLDILQTTNKGESQRSKVNAFTLNCRSTLSQIHTQETMAEQGKKKGRFPCSSTEESLWAPDIETREDKESRGRKT